MTPLQGMGIELEFDPGPIVKGSNPHRCQIDALPRWCGTRLPFVLEAVRLVRANAPARRAAHRLRRSAFPLFCYLVCGDLEGVCRGACLFVCTC